LTLDDVMLKVSTELLGPCVCTFSYCFQGKEVATDIEKLPEGTVIFEDITADKITGRILKTLKVQNGRRPSDPLGGRIFYEK
jgi:hypothetical protein